MTLKLRLLEVEATCLETGRARYIPQLLGYSLDELETLKKEQGGERVVLDVVERNWRPGLSVSGLGRHSLTSRE